MTLSRLVLTFLTAIETFIVSFASKFFRLIRFFGSFVRRKTFARPKLTFFILVLLFGISSFAVVLKRHHKRLDTLIWYDRCVLDEYSALKNLRSENDSLRYTNTEIDDGSGDKQHFLLYGPQFGLSNQLIALRNAVLIGHLLNRTVIVPPLMDSANNLDGGILYSTAFNINAFQAKYPNLLLDFSDYVNHPLAEHSLHRLAKIHFPFHILTPTDSYISSLSSSQSSYSLIINSRQVVVKPGLSQLESLISPSSAQRPGNSSLSIPSISIPPLVRSASSWSRLLSTCSDGTLALSLTYGLHSSDSLCPGCTPYEFRMIQDLFSPSQTFVDLMFEMVKYLNTPTLNQNHFSFSCVHIRLTDFVETCKVNLNSIKAKNGLACDLSLNPNVIAGQIKHALQENNVWPSVVDGRHLNIYVSTDNVTFLSGLKLAMNQKLEAISLKKENSESWVHSSDLLRFVTIDDVLADINRRSIVSEMVSEFGFLTDSFRLTRTTLDKHKNIAEGIIRALIDQFVCSKSHVKILNAFSTFSRMIEMYSESDSESVAYYWSSLDANKPKRVH